MILGRDDAPGDKKFEIHDLQMPFTFFKNTLFLLVLVSFSCGSQNKEVNENEANDIVIHDVVRLDDLKKSEVKNMQSKGVIVGAERPDLYKAILTGKNIGVVANQTSVVRSAAFLNGSSSTEKSVHLVDFLIENEQTVKAVFAPEHGFRGTADAGEKVKDGIDPKTGIPIISLYGDNKKPKLERLADTSLVRQDINKGVAMIDMMVFDLQDVGARFYTYISTLHYVMEACAEAGIPLIVLDRPNPNGHYIDGPILEAKHASFVGMHPVPVVHGMTIGEYAQMINGQAWLKNGIKCKLTVIPVQNYRHNTPYTLPIKPSPNLPNDKAINLYPSLCFFEGTFVSAGRGTDMQFQIFGAPQLPSKYFPFSFTPKSNEGATNPKFKGEQCNGLDLRNTEQLHNLNLEWLIEAYAAYGKKSDFFNPFFTKLAGTEKLQQQIEQGYTNQEIRASWSRDLEAYNSMRQYYMIYQ